MPASVRQRIIEALQARLQAIAIADGFQTDAGRAVFLGEQPAFGEDDPATAIVVVVQDDRNEFQQLKLGILLPVEIQALATAALDTPWLAAEAVLADIKRAIELEDRTLNGLVKRQLERGTTRTVPREPGSLVVGIGITYLARYQESWGAP